MSLAADFPDFESILYSSKTPDEASEKYIKVLRETGQMRNILYANQLIARNEMLQPKNIDDLYTDYLDLKASALRFWTAENKESIRISYRRKSDIRLHNKIRSKLVCPKETLNLTDLLGFRFVLRTDITDDQKSVELCYSLLNAIIEYFVRQKFATPLERRVPISTKLNKDLYPDIYIPKKSLVPKEFSMSVKDYIKYPKDKGYQGLHVSLQKPNGTIFEVQIRTFAMDVRAEIGRVAHDIYEEDRVSETDIKLDYSKIKMPGFGYIPEKGRILDNIGLIIAMDPFNNL